MASKENEIDSADMDDDLDFGDFEFEIEDLPNDREPTSKPAQALKRGVKKGLTDTAHIENLMTRNLPKDYGRSLKSLKDIQKGAKGFARDVTEQAKPIIGDLAYAAEKFLPSSLKGTKEKLKNIQKWSEGYQSETKSKEQLREEQLGITLGRIFEQQREQDQEEKEVDDEIEKKEKALDRSINIAQHKDVLGVLTRIANDANALSTYNNKINAAWQQKMLETNYRQLFALEDSLEESKKTNASVIANLEAITKNTALPEYRKTQRDEAFLEETRRRFSSKIVDLSGDFFKKGVEKLKGEVSSAMSQLGGMTSMVKMLAEQHEAEMEMGGETVEDKLVAMGGNQIGKWITSKAGKKLFELAKKNPRIVEAIVQGQQTLRGFNQDGAGIFRRFLDNRAEGGGFGSGAAEWLKNIFQFEQPDTSLKHYNYQDIYQPVPFTDKVARSITDVIPGYLARILQAQMAMLPPGAARAIGGDNLIKYDWNKAEFATSRAITKAVEAEMSAQELSKHSETYFKPIFEKIEDHAELDNNERSEIAKALLEISFDQQNIMPSKLTSPDFWKDYVDYDVADKAANAFKEIYGTESDKEFYSNYKQDFNRKREALDTNENIKNLTGLRKDLVSKAQFLIDNGMMKEAMAGKMLDEKGNLNLAEIYKNSTVINQSFKNAERTRGDLVQEYMKMDITSEMDKSIPQWAADKTKSAYDRIRGKKGDAANDDPLKDGEGRSDVNVKTDIKPTDSVLQAVSRIPIYNWRYKEGHEDNGATENIGPMAQDLHKTFGEEVAPTGKKIDLVNANGIAMKAIQELNTKLGSLEQKTSSFMGDAYAEKKAPTIMGPKKPPTALEALRGIDKNTAILVEQGQNLFNISRDSMAALVNGLGVLVPNMNFGVMTEEARKIYEQALKQGNKAKSFLGTLGDSFTELLGDGFERGKNLGKATFSKAWDIVKGANEMFGNFRDKVKLKAMETFDVYVGTEKEPRMTALKMKLNRYTDFSTGDTIKTRAQIREIKVGVMENMGEDQEPLIVLRAEELNDAYFVNTWKNGIQKIIEGSGDFFGRMAKSSWNKIIKPVAGGLRTIARDLKHGVAGILDTPVDIFIRGKPETPVMLAKKMSEGIYIDLADGTPITRPSQIKGAVFDTEKERIALSNDEFREGIVDIYGKPISKSPYLNFAKKAAAFTLGVGGSIAKWGWEKLQKAPGMIGGAMRAGSKMMGDFWSKLGLPDIQFGTLFGQESTDLLRDIRGILLYQNGFGGKASDFLKLATLPLRGDKKNVKLSQQSNQIQKAQKTPQGLVSSAMTTFNKGAAANDEPTNVNEAKPQAPMQQAANEGGFDVFSKAKDMVGGAFDMGKGVLDRFRNRKKKGGKGSFLGTLLGRENNTEKEKDKDDTKAVADNAVKAANQAHEQSAQEKKRNLQKKKKHLKLVSKDGKLLDENGNRSGDWKSIIANQRNVNEAVIKDKQEVRQHAITSIFKMLADMTRGFKDKMKKWLSSAGDPADIADDIADAADEFDRDGKRKGRRGRRGRGRVGRGKAGKLGKIANQGKAVETAGKAAGVANNAGKVAGAANTAGKAMTAGEAIAAGGGAAAAAGAASKGGKMYEMGKKVGGALKGFKPSWIKGLGLVGSAFSAYSAYDNFSKGNYVSGAIDTALTVAGLATTIWGAGAVIGAVGGAISAVGLPVIAAVVGVGLALWLGYKGLKWILQKEFNYTEKMRMLEYGLRGGDDDLMRTIFALEQYIEPFTTVTDQECNIDEKKVEMKEIYSIFDIDKNDTKRQADFTAWFYQRFKPIYGKWKVLTKVIKKSDKINDLGKVSDDEVVELTKAFKLSPECYTLGASPFKEAKLNTDPSVIDTFRVHWLGQIKDRAAKKKDANLDRKVNESGLAMIAERDGDPLGHKSTASKATDLATRTAADAVVNGKDAKDTGQGAKTIIKSEYDNQALSGMVSAVDAVRLKCYGLVVMKPSAIRALRNLDAIMVDFVKVDGSGRATFEADAGYILNKTAGFFGINYKDEDQVKVWTTWFLTRYLPVYLTMHNVLANVTGRSDIKGNLKYMERAKASEMLVMARAMMGVKGIWEIKEYAFIGQEAGRNPGVCQENIKFLESTADEEAVTEQKLGQSQSIPQDAKVVENNKIAESYTARQQNQSNQSKQQNRTAADAVGISDEPEPASNGNRSGGASAITTDKSPAVPGALPAAPGELFSGAGGLDFVKLNDGAKLEGLHPSVKRLFLGMAEEYGKLTGKKLQVNTAYRTYAEQAKLYRDLGPEKAARPGTSLHEYGLALDVQTTDLDALEKMGLLRKYGFTRPLGNETWHIEPAGLYDAKVRQRSKTDHGFATPYIESSPGRGGGGLGMRKGGRVRRDDQYAKNIFDAASRAIEDQQAKQVPTPEKPNLQEPSNGAGSTASDMTKAATVGAQSPLAGGMPEGEPGQGIASMTTGSNSVKDAANDSDIRASYPTPVKGTGGQYDKLPDSKGTGWSGNGDMILEAAKMVGVDPALAAAIAAKESSLNPGAMAKTKNPAKGLYQFKDATFTDQMQRYGKKYGIPTSATSMDPKANAILGLEYIKQSVNNSDGSLVGGYLGHMLGPTGAKRFMALRDGMFPGRVMTSAANDNANIFFHGGDKSRPRTKREIMDLLTNQLNQQLSAFKIPLEFSDKVASNDSSVDTAANQAPSAAAPIQKLTDESQSPKMIRASYEPASTPAKPSYNPAVEKLTQSDPMPSRAIPVVENTNNGFAKLEKLSQDTVNEQKRTNEILTDIKDLLGNKLAEFNSQRGSAPQRTTDASIKETVKPPDAISASVSRKTPSVLPDSFVQRRRA
jgi:hypothetical protein